MSRILILAAAATLGAVAAVGAAIAQPGHGAHGGAGGPPMMMMMHEHLAGLDKDGDGFITRDEFLAHPSDMFARLDTDHDGRISKIELAAMAAMHGDHRVCKVQKDGDAAPKDVPCESLPPMAGGPGDHMVMMMHNMAEKLDLDHDGRLSFSEFQAPMHDHFSKMDKNGDGYISKDEMPSGDMVFEQHIEKKN